MDSKTAPPANSATFFGSLANRTTVFSGLGRGSGKTSALGLALHEARKAGPVAVFTVGFEGGDASSIKIGPGDIVVTTAPLARSSDAALETIGALPGRSAIGQLCLCRAVRAGAVSPVGPGHLSQLAGAVEFVFGEGLAKSALVDGAGGRITQAGALPDCQLAYCAMADGANYRRVAQNIEMVAALAALPVDACLDKDGNGMLWVDGPLTQPMADGLGKGIARISIDTFTDCFLNPPEFRSAAQRYNIAVRRQVPLLGFVLGLKNLEPRAFPVAAPIKAKILFNPFGTGTLPQ